MNGLPEKRQITNPADALGRMIMKVEFMDSRNNRMRKESIKKLKEVYIKKIFFYYTGTIFTYHVLLIYIHL